MWLFAAIVILLIGGIAAVAVGRGDSLAEDYDDRPDVRVQANGPLTAGDLRAMRFDTVVRGYRASEVDALLARLADQLGGPEGSPAGANEAGRADGSDGADEGRSD